jgi:hypothetical protein
VGERVKFWGCHAVYENSINMHSGSKEKRESLKLKSEFADQNLKKKKKKRHKYFRL